MRLNSIKAKSLIYLLSFIFILISLITFLSLHKLKDLLYYSVDQTLKNEADIIIGLMKQDKKDIELEITEINSGFYMIPKSGHYYKIQINSNNSGFKVHDSDEIFNKVVSKSLGDENFNFKILSIEKNIPEKDEIFFLSVGFNNEPLRVLKKNINFMGNDIELYISEPIADTLRIIKEFNFFIIILSLVSLGVSIIIITFLINSFLKPLKSFSKELSNISHKNLNQTIKDSSYPSELKEMVYSFNNMMKRINNAFETEKRILSEASHKLKTPIAVIKSYCDVTLKKDREKHEYIETLNSVKNVTNKVISLISGILTLSKLESESIKYNSFERVSIKECLENTVSLTKYLAYQKNINIEFISNVEVYVLADKDKLIEAFVNIVENAIKYNKQNGFIKISTLTKDDKVYISIKDSGIGIDKENQDKVFNRFYRVDSFIEGSGLGLNISKTIIDNHNGIITFNSKVNEGTEFIITLPILF